MEPSWEPILQVEGIRQVRGLTITMGQLNHLRYVLGAHPPSKRGQFLDFSGPTSNGCTSKLLGEEGDLREMFEVVLRELWALLLTTLKSGHGGPAAAITKHSCSGSCCSKSPRWKASGKWKAITARQASSVSQERWRHRSPTKVSKAIAAEPTPEKKLNKA